MKRRISTVILKIIVSMICMWFSAEAFSEGGFSSSIIAGILFLIGVFHHVFWPYEEFDNENPSN